MEINKLIILVFTIGFTSCSNKKNISKNPGTFPVSQQGTEDALTSEYSEYDEPQEEQENDISTEPSTDSGNSSKQESSKETLRIVSVSLEGLVNSQDNELSANSTIGTLTAEFSDESISPPGVVYTIKATPETDYELFFLEGTKLLNKEALVGDRRFALSIEAQTKDFSFQATVIFSISAGELPPESPQNILFQANTELGEDNLVGSFTVVDDERFDHIVELIAGDNPNNNSFFTVLGDKLYASEEFIEQDDYVISVQAKNSAFEDLTFATEVTFSIAVPADEPVDVPADEPVDVPAEVPPATGLTITLLDSMFDGVVPFTLINQDFRSTIVCRNVDNPPLNIATQGLVDINANNMISFDNLAVEIPVGNTCELRISIDSSQFNGSNNLEGDGYRYESGFISGTTLLSYAAYTGMVTVVANSALSLNGGTFTKDPGFNYISN